MRRLYCAGVWEHNEGIFHAAKHCLTGRGIALICGRHPAQLAGADLALLTVSPGAAGWAGAGALDCRTVLLPGAAGPLARALRADCAVSYGTSPKDSLTFSSLDGNRICLAVQRELVTLDGAVLERQELVLPFPPGLAPSVFLAWAGTLLLAGLPPEQVRWPDGV